MKSNTDIFFAYNLSVWVHWFRIKILNNHYLMSWQEIMTYFINISKLINYILKKNIEILAKSIVLSIEI